MTDPRRPLFEAFTIKDQTNRPAKWTKIGAVWENRDGSANLELDAMPLNSRIVLRKPKEQAAAGDTAPSDEPPATE